MLKVYFYTTRDSSPKKLSLVIIYSLPCFSNIKMKCAEALFLVKSVCILVSKSTCLKSMLIFFSSMRFPICDVCFQPVAFFITSPLAQGTWKQGLKKDERHLYQYCSMIYSDQLSFTLLSACLAQNNEAHCQTLCLIARNQDHDNDLIFTVYDIMHLGSGLFSYSSVADLIQMFDSMQDEIRNVILLNYCNQKVQRWSGYI